MKDNAPITDEALRKRTARFVAAAFDSTKMNRVQFSKEAGLSYTKYLADYLIGRCCPTVEKILRMHKLTGVNPESFGIPVFSALKCAERMREMIREGCTESEFIKALQPLHRQCTQKLAEGYSVNTLSLVKFHHYWHANDVENLVLDPAFRASCVRKHVPSALRAEVEYKYISTAWGALAETAREVRTGLWEWFSDSIYRMELEHMGEDNYEFRSYLKNTGELSTKREVKIA